jgi:hypothetical protein
VDTTGRPQTQPGYSTIEGCVRHTSSGFLLSVLNHSIEFSLEGTNLEGAVDKVVSIVYRGTLPAAGNVLRVDSYRSIRRCALSPTLLADGVQIGLIAGNMLSRIGPVAGFNLTLGSYQAGYHRSRLRPFLEASQFRRVARSGTAPSAESLVPATDLNGGLEVLLSRLNLPPHRNRETQQKGTFYAGAGAGLLHFHPMISASQPAGNAPTLNAKLGLAYYPLGRSAFGFGFEIKGYVPIIRDSRRFGCASLILFYQTKPRG